MARFSLFIATFFLLLANSAFAAKVTKVDAEKKLVTIDEGTETNFAKGSKICFYSESDSKLGCAFIRSAKAKIAFIKIKGAKLFEKIAVGINVKLESSPDPSSSTVSENSKPEAKTKSTDTKKTYIAALTGLPIISPISYQNLVYETPVAGSQVSSMWKKSGVIKSIGVGLEAGLGLASYQLVLGARTRFFISKDISSDYADADNDAAHIFEQYVETSSKTSSLGFWFDFYWLHRNYGVANFRLGTGLESDSSKINFQALQKSDADTNETIIYQGKSSLNALSLRLLPRLDFNFGHFAISLAAAIYVPLSQSSKFTLSTFNDPKAIQSLDPALTAEADLKNSLKHEAKVGAELMLSTGFNF